MKKNRRDMIIGFMPNDKTTQKEVKK